MVTLTLRHLLLGAGFLTLVGSLWVFAIMNSTREDDFGKVVDAESRRFDRAQLRKDRGELSNLLANDMQFVRGSGVLAGKNEFIAAFTDPETVFTSFNIRERKVIVLGENAAIVTAMATIRGSSAGEVFEERIRYSDLFAQRDGRLRVIHVQVTPLAGS